MAAPDRANDAETGLETVSHGRVPPGAMGAIRDARQPRAGAPASPERPAASRNIAHEVAGILRDDIVTLVLRPGAMLSEQDVGRRLGVSRQPVREAFIKLAEARLVVIRPQRGTQVVRIARAEIAHALFVRDAIECAVVREAARRIEPETLAMLADNLARQRAVLLDPDGGFEAMFAIDESFHSTLARVAGRPDVWAVVDRIKPHLDRLHWLNRPTRPSLDPVVAHHQDILDAIRLRDPGLAAERMAAHIRGGGVSSIDELATRHPDLFDDGDLAEN